jgi:hypothetical protein
MVQVQTEGYKTVIKDGGSSPEGVSVGSPVGDEGSQVLLGGKDFVRGKGTVCGIHPNPGVLRESVKRDRRHGQ